MIIKPRYKIVHSLNGLGFNRYTPEVKYPGMIGYSPLPALTHKGSTWYATQEQAKAAIDKHLEKYLMEADEVVDEIPYIPSLAAAKDPCVSKETNNG